MPSTSSIQHLLVVDDSDTISDTSSGTMYHNHISTFYLSLILIVGAAPHILPTSSTSTTTPSPVPTMLVSSHSCGLWPVEEESW